MTKKEELVLNIEKKLKETSCRNLYDEYFDDWKYHMIRDKSKKQLMTTVKFLAHMLSYNMEKRQMSNTQFEEFYYDYLHNGMQRS